MNKIDVKKIIQMSIWVILSSVIQSLAWANFLLPANLYASGVSGLLNLISNILLDFYNINFPFQILYFSINVILAFFVYKYIGKYFTIFSLVQTTLVSILSSFFKQYIYLDDLLLISIFGGIINGFAVGLALQGNASTGGIDFLSIYYSNRFNKSMWNTIFAFNCLVIGVAGILYGWEKACYTIIFQFCSTQVVNRMHKRFTHQALNIITKEPDKVSSSIFKNTRHGITEMKAIGAFKKEDTSMLYMVINSYQVNDVIKAVHDVDPNAFISVSNVKEVVGNYYQKPLD